MGYFLPSYPITAQNIKNSKKWKKHLEISSFYTIVLKITIICYTVPEIWLMMDAINISFGVFFPFTPITAQKWNNDDVRFLPYDVRQTDGLTDGQINGLTEAKKIRVRPWHDAQANQQKGGLRGWWKAHPAIKVRGLIPPTQNSQ